MAHYQKTNNRKTDIRAQTEGKKKILTKIKTDKGKRQNEKFDNKLCDKCYPARTCPQFRT